MLLLGIILGAFGVSNMPLLDYFKEIEGRAL